MKPIRVRSRLGDYEVVVASGAWDGLGARLRGLGLTGRAALVTDTNVWRHWGPAVRMQLTGEFGAAPARVLRAGEPTKSLASAKALYDWLAALRFTRKDAVVALGGGVVGDLAGFVAATYHRGLPLVQLPTSLLAMVDSSIGGKVGVDLPQGKNLVGAFYPPRAVIADTRALATLPVRQRWSGLAEVVKAGLVADAKLVAELERNLEDLGEGRADPTAVVLRAAAIKAGIVSADEREGGRRVILNFGHTLGHALEAATGYRRLLHGEAVVMGMRAAIDLSYGATNLPVRDGTRAKDLLFRFPTTRKMPAPTRARLLELIRGDKKGPTWVVLERVGRATTATDLAPALVASVVDDARATLKEPWRR